MGVTDFQELKTNSNLSWGAIVAWSVFLAWTVFYVTSSYHTLNRNDSQLLSLQTQFDTEIDYLKQELNRVEGQIMSTYNELKEEFRADIDEVEALHSTDIEYFNGRLDRKVSDVESQLEHHKEEEH